MRILLNTLYVTTPESYISKDGQNFVISIKGVEKFRVPAVNIEGIVTFGYAGVSPGVMNLCSDNGIALSFLSPNGRFIGRLQGPTHGNVLLRKMQYSVSENTDRSLALAKLFISGKIQNYKLILQRRLRDYGESETVSNAIRSLNNQKEASLNAESADVLRGVEGLAASNYFEVFNEMLTNQSSDFCFNGRNRRPPRDPINAMLSFIYTLLAHDISSALETVGLDPYVGFFHTIRPGRTSLALDLMEEMRAYLGDRLVISLINRRQVKPNDFIKQGDQSVIMTESCRKNIITAWQQRKRELITHPFINEKISIGLIPYTQSMLLARYLRGDIDNYPVFIIK